MQFKLYQKVKVKTGKYQGRVGYISSIRSYGSIDVQFDEWISPKNNRGRLIPVTFTESEIEPFRSGS